MIKFDIDEMKNKYIDFSNSWFKKIEEKGMTLGDDIKLKLEHGLAMSDTVANTTNKSGFFNESYISSGAVDGLLHDVGRFPQYYLSGTLKDDVSKEFTGFEDHGKYGAHILIEDNNKLLRHFLGDNKEYDKVITEVVKEHTTITNQDYIYDIKDLTNLFQNYDILEVINNEELVNKLIALKLLVLREEDSLEILHKIRDGLWKPMISSEKDKLINDTAWDIFINQGYINMAELKAKGLWSCNVGFLLRYSLLFHNINFVGTLKNILDDDIITKIYNNQKNNTKDDQGNIITDSSLIDPKLKSAMEYTKLAIENLILTSPDGKIITSDSKEQAKIKTLNEYSK